MKPELLRALIHEGLLAQSPPPTVNPRSPIAELLAFEARQHAAYEETYERIADGLPGDRSDIAVDDQTVAGVDGNEIRLRIFRDSHLKGARPGVVYVHGGSMVTLTAFNRVHQRWCEDLASAGLVVVAVDFRNAYTATSHNPFPAGLADVMSAVHWVAGHRRDLGIAQLALQGESGGANLVLAAGIRAAREGSLAEIDGIYAAAPYISGAYGWEAARKLAELPSLVELDGYLIGTEVMAIDAVVYDPHGKNAENPLAWPYFASKRDLAGLPPHLIVVDELDPLRDEGVAYFRKLLAAGVTAVGTTNLGLTHVATLMFRRALAADRFTAVRTVAGFAGSLGRQDIGG